jgi:hypothetical protein
MDKMGATGLIGGAPIVEIRPVRGICLSIRRERH